MTEASGNVNRSQAGADVQQSDQLVEVEEPRSGTSDDERYLMTQVHRARQPLGALWLRMAEDEPYLGSDSFSPAG